MNIKAPVGQLLWDITDSKTMATKIANSMVLRGYAYIKRKKYLGYMVLI